MKIHFYFNNESGKLWVVQWMEISLNNSIVMKKYPILLMLLICNQSEVVFLYGFFSQSWCAFYSILQKLLSDKEIIAGWKVNPLICVKLSFAQTDWFRWERDDGLRGYGQMDSMQVHIIHLAELSNHEWSS